MSSAVDFTKKAFVIVTGASQGIGRTIAIEVGSRLGKGSKVILTARSEEGLNATKQAITAKNKNILVSVYPLDLSQADNKQYEDIFDESVQAEERYDLSVIFHNAGQLGALKVTTELNDLDVWIDYYKLNVFSAVLLNSVFIKKSRSFAKRIVVVNISSLCGHKPFVNTALYGSAKASRDLFFSVLTEEESDITVLKYCPGPVDTAMFNEIVTGAQDDELRAQFQEIKNTSVLSTEQTVQKLMGVLESGRFKSGDLIDYYDIA